MVALVPNNSPFSTHLNIDVWTLYTHALKKNSSLQLDFRNRFWKEAIKFDSTSIDIGRAYSDLNVLKLQRTSMRIMTQPAWM